MCEKYYGLDKMSARLELMICRSFICVTSSYPKIELFKRGVHLYKCSLKAVEVQGHSPAENKKVYTYMYITFYKSLLTCWHILLAIAKYIFSYCSTRVISKRKKKKSFFEESRAIILVNIHTWCDRMHNAFQTMTLIFRVDSLLNYSREIRESWITSARRADVLVYLYFNRRARWS